MSHSPERFTLRDLPMPAKLVVSAFLMSVGLGYLWAMAQIHFKHASPGTPMPTVEDLVNRFSGVPWPIQEKPEAPAPQAQKPEPLAKADPKAGQVDGIKIKSLINARCVWCHGKDGEKDDAPLDTYDNLEKYLAPGPDYPKGHLHTVLTGDPTLWSRKSMVRAFSNKASDWDELNEEQRKAILPKRDTERQALISWVEAGGPKVEYEMDQAPLPPGFPSKDLSDQFRTKAPVRPLAAAANPPIDPWKQAKKKQLSIEALTQSTHAHLLSFSMLWALTGICFAFSGRSYRMRCLISPLVLIVQVLDIGCWWLARLNGVGPYFAIAIIATGGIVGLGLGAQITLSLFSMYGTKGKMFLAAMFLAGAALFGITYLTVIKPQLDEEKQFAAQQAK
jgi:hypothetical protein